MRGNDYYELLGVSRGATPAEIRSAYRALAKRMHPDTGGTAGTFRMLREAYETLSDPDLREDYDNDDCYDDDCYDDDLDEAHGDESDEDPAPSPTRVRRADPAYEPRLPTIDPATVPWWREVRPNAPMVLSPTARPAPQEVAAGAAGGALVLSVLLLVGAPAVVVVCWMLTLAIAGAVVARRHLAVHAADRAFLSELGGRAVFGSPGTEPDEVGERLTAELLARHLTRIPGVRVCHGLAAEVGSVFADVHHAVLCGRRLVLVESKLWLPGHYRVDEAGVLWRNGHRFRGGASGLRDRVAAYRDLLPGVEVRGVLLLYPSRPGTITVDDAFVEFPPMVPEGFVRVIGGWLAADPSTVDREALRTLVGQVVSPGASE